MKLRINRLDKSLPLPSYAHSYDAAVDLYSSEEVIMKWGEKKIIPTAIKIAIPNNHVGLIWDRSGLAAKHSLHTLAGVIDSGYRGEVKVVLINLGKEEFKIEKGMRIAQMLVQPVVQCDIEETEDLDETSRGEGGFGSTGY
ncbi:dUTP diphosphatase [Candidatus Woesearchaeota archaeon]|nr:dUTP diphosphatase [Candidatus Woesearchaeota archaeon]